MRVYRFIALWAMFVAVATAAMAQKFAVTGIAADSLGVGESFATIRIYQLPDTTKAAVLGVTAEDGSFEKPLPKAGNYRITLSSVGRSPLVRNFSVTASKPVARLDTLIFGMGEMLGEVVVTAAKPLISREIDRIGYDVESDPDAKTSQLDEMLKRVPMVTVDPDGTIKIKGSSNFKVYKNGRENSAFTKNAKDIFKGIPASMIKKIEVITDPGAREDAEGSSVILNIVTVDDLIIKGVMGNGGLYWGPSQNAPNPNLWLMSQLGKVTFSVYGNMWSNPSRNSFETHTTDRTFDDSDNHSHEQTTQKSSSLGVNAGLELSYELDSLDLFTVEFWTYVGQSKTRSDYTYGMFDPSDNLIYGYDSRRITDPSRHHWLGGTFNYQRLTRRKGEKIIVSYNISGNGSMSKVSNTYSNMINMPDNLASTFTDNHATFLEQIAQADWSRPLAEGHTLDIGAKYINRNNNSRSDQTYLNDRDYHSDFSHITQVGAIYADYRLNLKKWGFRAGLRYEYSRLEAKFKDGSAPDYHSDLNDVVPNVAVSYNINDRNSMRLSYSSSIQRPGINYLNPTEVVTPQSTSVGNPDLSSMRNHSVHLNYSLFTAKVSVDLNASYHFTNNSIIAVQSLLDDDRMFTTYANAGRSHSFYASAWFNIQAGAKTRIMGSLGANWSHLANPGIDIAVNSWSPLAYLRFNQKLPWKLNLGAWLHYWGPSRSMYQRFEPVGMSRLDHGLDLQRSFLKEDRLTVRLSVTNPFGNGRQHTRSWAINLPYQQHNNSVEEHQRSFGISVQYRFGSLNAQVKKVRSVQSGDMVGGPSR